jgi:hypothetical protein
MAHKRKPVRTIETPCTGDAHKNPHIDHCMVCMPRWGVVVRNIYVSARGLTRYCMICQKRIKGGEEYELGKNFYGEELTSKVKHHSCIERKRAEQRAAHDAMLDRLAEIRKQGVS